jgi:hypothetical protein
VPSGTPHERIRARPPACAAPVWMPIRLAYLLNTAMTRATLLPRRKTSPAACMHPSHLHGCSGHVHTRAADFEVTATSAISFSLRLLGEFVMCKQEDERCVGGGAKAASLAHLDSDRLINSATSSRQLPPFPSTIDMPHNQAVGPPLAVAELDRAQSSPPIRICCEASRPEATCHALLG